MAPSFEFSFILHAGDLVFTNPASRKETSVQLPKYKKKKRIKLKICQYCGKEFWGHPIAKYCELHRDVKQREKTKKSPEPGDSNNRTYNHEYIEVVEEPWTCELDGCGKTYMVKIFPKQFVYPRFCEEHRNEFRRRNWIRAKLLEDLRKSRAPVARPAAPELDLSGEDGEVRKSPKIAKVVPRTTGAVRPKASAAKAPAAKAPAKSGVAKAKPASETKAKAKK